jgi:cytochrome b pre-mRNA-processing protein 3
MSLLKRLLRPRGDDLARYRPLWHRLVELSRDPRWYREGGVADTVVGRFDAVTLVLSAVLLRMERDEALIEPSARLTDLVVGKHMGKLMGALGGRLGGYREALAQQGNAALGEAITRNVTLRDGASPDGAAELMRALTVSLAGIDSDALLAGNIAL